MSQLIVKSPTNTHELYSSLDELSPESLSQIEGRRITEVTIEPFEPKTSATGNPFLSVRTDGNPPSRFIVKRMSREWDWIMHATDDLLCREVQLWSSGILDRLPPELIHATLACAEDVNGWAILMVDRSDIFSDDTEFDARANRCYLNSLAALHARYLDDPALLDPAIGLCTVDRYLTCASPPVLSTVTVGDRPADFIKAWVPLDECLSPETAGTIRSLHRDPSPLCVALEQFPQTLIHGDWGPHNVAPCSPTATETLAIDWQFALRSAPVVDLARLPGTLAHICTT